MTMMLSFCPTISSVSDEIEAYPNKITVALWKVQQFPCLKGCVETSCYGHGQAR